MNYAFLFLKSIYYHDNLTRYQYKVLKLKAKKSINYNCTF
jgi:hypothetical protein